MHPIEMLRAVARSRLDSPGELAAEAAWGLGALADEEPAAVLPACRRLLERQPACGPLWWLAARMLTAGDPSGEAALCSSLLLEDRTPEVLHSALLKAATGGAPRVIRQGGVGEIAAADFVVIEASAVGADQMVIPSSRYGLLRAAVESGTRVWIEAGVGRILPPKIWEALAKRVEANDDWRRGDQIESLEGVEMVVDQLGPTAVGDLGPKAANACPEPPELIGGW